MPERNVKKCIDCAAEIDKSAKKCVKCGAFQGVRRFLNISTTFLSLIIALLSVLGIVVPILKEEFSGHQSNIDVRLISSETIKAESSKSNKIENREFHSVKYVLPFTIIVENSGNSAGIFQQAEISIYASQDESLEVGSVWLSANNYSQKIPPGEVVLINGEDVVIDTKPSYFPETQNTAIGMSPNGRLFSRLHLTASVWNYGEGQSVDESFIGRSESQMNYDGIK